MADEKVAECSNQLLGKKKQVKRVFDKKTETTSSFLSDIWKPRENVKKENLRHQTIEGGKIDNISDISYAKIEHEDVQDSWAGTKNCLSVQEVFDNGFDNNLECSSVCSDDKDNRYINDFESLQSYKASEYFMPIRLLMIIQLPVKDKDIGWEDDNTKESGIDTVLKMFSSTKNEAESTTRKSIEYELTKSSRPPPKPPRKIENAGDIAENLELTVSDHEKDINKEVKDYNSLSSLNNDLSENSDCISSGNRTCLMSRDSSTSNSTDEISELSLSVDLIHSDISQPETPLSCSLTANFQQNTSQTLDHANPFLSEDNSTTDFLKDETHSNEFRQSATDANPANVELLTTHPAKSKNSCDHQPSSAFLSDFDDPLDFNDFPNEHVDECGPSKSNEMSLQHEDHYCHHTNHTTLDQYDESYQLEEMEKQHYPDSSHKAHVCYHCHPFTKSQKMLQELADTEDLEIHDVVPDGNCMFRAIIDQLRMQGELTLTCNQIRKMAVDYLRENPLQEDGTHMEDFFVADGESWEQYLKRMSKDGEWGDQIILRGLCEVVHREICIISTIGERHNQTTILPRDMGDKCDVKKIYLGHVNDQHYYSLRPKGWQDTWYKEARRVMFLRQLKHIQEKQPSEKDSKDNNPTESIWLPCTQSKLINCNMQFFDEYSQVPIHHLTFIVANVLHKRNIITPYQWYGRSYLAPMDNLNFECLGSVEEDLAVNLYVDQHLGVVGKHHNFNAPKVSTWPNFYKNYGEKKIVFMNDSYEMNSNVIIIDPKGASPGYTHLQLSKHHPHLFYRKINGTFFLKNSYLTSMTKSGRYDKWDRSYKKTCSKSALFKKDNSITFYLGKCPRWPDETREWISRKRPSGWPSQDLMKEALEVPCVLTPKAHPHSTESDIEWMFDFSFVERFLLRDKISDEQRHCFHVFKLLMDFHTGNVLELSTFILKTIFLYTLEIMPQSQWKTCPSACLLYMTEMLLECLKRKNIPQYFIPQNNIISHLRGEDIYMLVEKVNVVREFPVMSLVIMAESHGVMTTFGIDQIIEDLNSYCSDSNMHNSILNAFIPAYFKIITTSLDLKKFAEAADAVSNGFKLLQDLPRLLEGNDNPYKNISLVLFMQLALAEKNVYQAWWLCFFVDLYKKKQTVSSFTFNYPFKTISDMMVDNCPSGELDNICVPNFVLETVSPIFKLNKDIGFLMQMCTFLFKEKEFQLCAHYLRGLTKIFIKAINNPDAIIAECLQDYESRGNIADSQLDYVMQTYISELYRCWFEVLNCLSLCYIYMGQTEYFQEYIELFETVCDKVPSASVYQCLAAAWKALGNTKKMQEALIKHRSFH